MNKDHNELISELVHDLPASSRSGRTLDIILLWLVLNFTIALLLISFTGSFREGSLQQAIEYPRFLVESLTGMLAIVLLAVGAFHSGIPSNIPDMKRFLPALMVLIAWLGFYVVGIWSPALEPSMLGKRNFLCYVETLLYGLPSMVIGFYLIGRLWPLRGAWTGLMIGLAAGATSALIMQFACMYIPVHIITHHLIPGLILGLIGLFAGKYFLTKTKNT